jgi:signal transduction histidine kinase
MGMLNDSIENIRGIAKDLMPPTLIKLGFEKGVLELFRQINASSEIKIEHVFDFREVRLPAKTELQLFRIMQEMINNIIKHSNAKQVNVLCRANADEAMISVSHDGAGLTSEAVMQLTDKDQGIGLKSIQSRAQLIGASIQYLILGDGNAKILIDIPLHNEKNN